MRDTQSPIAQLAQAIESALAARRARLEERLQRVEHALKNYRLAAEARLAKEFAGEHHFAQHSAVPAPSLERAAELLLTAVRALPELEPREAAAQQAAGGEPAAPAPVAKEQPAPSGQRAASAGSVSSQSASSQSASSQAASSKSGGREEAVASEFPLLVAAAAAGKLVVIGALSGRDKSPALPAELALAVEWIDTEREGAHAIGNLPQRVRQGRVAALVILHRAVGHRHTDAVTTAARERDVPLAFAGQGGKASLLRAFTQLELMLSQRPPLPVARQGRPARSK